MLPRPRLPPAPARPGHVRPARRRSRSGAPTEIPRTVRSRRHRLRQSAHRCPTTAAAIGGAAAPPRSIAPLSSSRSRGRVDLRPDVEALSSWKLISTRPARRAMGNVRSACRSAANVPVRLDVEHDDERAEDELDLAAEMLRIQDGQQVLLDEIAFVTRKSAAVAELVLEGRQRTDPAGEFYER